jgi:hypothetical protein
MILVMFCPECRAEYRPGFTRCSDCDVDLVHEIPEQDTRVRKRGSATMLPTFRNMYREGGRTVRWWTSYRHQTGGWLVFNRHPFHELDCNSDWGRISHLVDRRTAFVALATLWSVSPRIASVHPSRELGKEESKTELSAKQQEASGRIATMNRVLSLLADRGPTFRDFVEGKARVLRNHRFRKQKAERG